MTNGKEAMIKIFRSDNFYGNRTFIERDPTVMHLQDHVYCPDGGFPGALPGIYDFGRKLVHQSTYCRGPDPSEIRPPFSAPFNYQDASDVANDETYIYVGWIHRHFGHFLLSTLSRLWQIEKNPNHKIIVFPKNELDLLLKQPHQIKMLQAFGVDPSRLVCFDRPTLIRNIILPCPALEERNFVHRVLATAYNKAGDNLAADANIKIPGNGPIYFSKSRMNSGVRKIMNEPDIDDILRKADISVIYPEELSIQDQIAIWRLDRTIVAFNGSSLHTSIFSENVKLVSVGWQNQIDTSFTLLDWANNARADYFHLENGTFTDIGPSDQLSARMVAVDPVSTAKAIIRAIEVAESGDRRSLARHCPTAQSSTYIEPGRNWSELSATSGRLTGLYQFTTHHEFNPWWSVDLERACKINTIIISNRTDDVPERANFINVETSLDGKIFELVYQHDGKAVFGNRLNGSPLVVNIKPAKTARFVRLSIPGPNFFHLDQVEVLGETISLS